jgi:hypothetical protein
MDLQKRETLTNIESEIQYLSRNSSIVHHIMVGYGNGDETQDIIVGYADTLRGYRYKQRKVSDSPKNSSSFKCEIGLISRQFTYQNKKLLCYTF